jgi:hypothetical protein
MLLDNADAAWFVAMWPQTRDCSPSFILTTEWNMESSMAMDMGSVVLSGSVLTDPKF